MRIGISANPKWFGNDLEKMFSTLKEQGFNSVDVGIDTSDETLNGMCEEATGSINTNVYIKECLQKRLFHI